MKRINALNTLLIAAAVQPAFAQESVPVEKKSGIASQSVYAYGDVFQYSGAGAPGELLTQEAVALSTSFGGALSTNIADTLFNAGVTADAIRVNGVPGDSLVIPGLNAPEAVEGTLFGGTLGYIANLNSGDRVFAQFSYRTGELDSTVASFRYDVEVDAVAGADYDAWDGVPGSATAPSTQTFTGSEYSSMNYTQDTDEYRFSVSYSPEKYNFFSVSLEYAYSDYKGDINGSYNVEGNPAFREDNQGNILFADLNGNGLYDAGEDIIDSQSGGVNTWTYGFDQTTHDIFVHVNLKSPAIVLAETGNDGVVATSLGGSLGGGYSIREGEVRQDTSGLTANYFETANPESFLNEDHFVVEGKATVGLSYSMGQHAIVGDVGYRYKADIDSDALGVDQSGLYGRLGYVFSW